MCEKDVEQQCIPNIPFFGKCCEPVPEGDKNGLIKYQEQYYGEGYSSAKIAWEAATKAQHALDLQHETEAVKAERGRVLDELAHSLETWDTLSDIESRIAALRRGK